MPFPAGLWTLELATSGTEHTGQQFGSWNFAA